MADLTKDLLNEAVAAIKEAAGNLGDLPKFNAASKLAFALNQVGRYVGAVSDRPTLDGTQDLLAALRIPQPLVEALQSLATSFTGSPQDLEAIETQIEQVYAACGLTPSGTGWSPDPTALSE